jgi:adenylate kinase
MSRPFRLTKNLTMIGPPGSGKGFYGRPLASNWKAPLWTASSILRASNLNVDSGQLLECQLVSDSILYHIQSNKQTNQTSGYILDGFPRTMQQVQLMETWPQEHRIQAAVQLDIPDFVCQAKVAGRRLCRVCKKEWNVAGVFQDGFNLPPQSTPDCNQCDPDTDWTRRPDDDTAIWRDRLRDYRQVESPLIEYFEQSNRLLKIRPYNGITDLPSIQHAVEAWLLSW